MSDNTLMIAAAGSGKTTYLVNKALQIENEKVLILTYTLANEDEIKKKLNYRIPNNITVQTWFSFLLKHGVRPYQGAMHDDLHYKEIKGMLLVNEPSGINYTNKRGIKVLFSEETNFDKHYFTKYMKIYSDKISKFVDKCNKKTNGKIINRLASIYDHIFIDEVQDLAGYDLELLKLFIKSDLNITLLGDPRQVTYLTHNSKKHSKYKNGAIKEYIQFICNTRTHCTIDEDALSCSHRNNIEICNYSSLLYPAPNFTETKPCECEECRNNLPDHQGIFIVKPKDAIDYLKTYKPVQLRWSKEEKIFNIELPVYNMGESKGMTFDRVVIYPTDDMKAWVLDNSTDLKNGTRAKFYVAITRARHSVAIIMDFNEEQVISGITKNSR